MSKQLTIIKRHALRWLLSLIILLFFILHTIGAIDPKWDTINPLERKAYDIRLNLTMPQTLDPRIVIIDIDEQSLSEMGRWPWNRSVMAHLIYQLFDTYQIDVLGMDVMFAESDNSSGLKKLQTLAQGRLKDEPVFLSTLTSLEKILDYDKMFAQSMQNRRIVLGYAFNTEKEKNNETGQLPVPTFTHEEIQSYDLTPRESFGFVANLPIFQTSAMTAGHFDLFLDPDGIVRRIPMFYSYKGQLYESFSLAVARIALGLPPVELDLYIEGGKFHLENLLIADHKIPVDKHLQTLVPYRGQGGSLGNSFTYVSATDIWHGRVKNSLVLKDKIVLLGTSAAGIQDLYNTSVQNLHPGVEIHANLISGILNNQMMSTLPPDNMLEIFLLIVIGIVMMSLLPLLSPLTATVATLALSGFVISFNLFIWNEQHSVLPLATTLLLILTQFIFNMSYGYVIESRNKRHLTNVFGQYVPPELVDEMNKNLGKQFSIEGESRNMTVLFSDVRGFTSISEKLDPKELSELMNEYLTPMTRTIHEYRGTIDKYMGDAIMAFWGAPLSDRQHARHAIDAAMEMVKYLDKMRSIFRAKGWPEIRVGIGLNTGVMSVGNMGSQFRMAYTVLGDAVNLGSRLEGITKQYSVQIIVSETTKEAVPEYLFRELDHVKVKGKDQPVAIFEPIGLHEQIDDSILAEIDEYKQALDDYRHQRWEIAKKQFDELQKKYPNRFLYTIYAKRVTYFMENPPGDKWDGVYTFTTK
ncbi:adenylate/guanylate cyclase domain-containing protein [Candidatus Parabeggiatoa sp. HSG14]|uniref:CHASE2 domain-containing protein n=1 Tax=Candidatus Parabeggiatoa sp. HSG14 TaxID=3055593 RepID=UPI0025A889FA|nr:adenylate/guanylate cyclase domain-containing protein [Thiotrichales bacterium HSG14]